MRTALHTPLIVSRRAAQKQETAAGTAQEVFGKLAAAEPPVAQVKCSPLSAGGGIGAMIGEQTARLRFICAAFDTDGAATLLFCKPRSINRANVTRPLSSVSFDSAARYVRAVTYFRCRNFRQ